MIVVRFPAAQSSVATRSCWQVSPRRRGRPLCRAGYNSPATRSSGSRDRGEA